MLLTYFLNDFEIVPVAPIITGIIFVFTFQRRCVSIVRSLYFRNFSASFLITLLYPEIATSINIHVPFPLSRIIMSGLFLGIVLSVCTCWFHNMVYYYYYYYHHYHHHHHHHHHQAKLFYLCLFRFKMLPCCILPVFEFLLLILRTSPCFLLLKKILCPLDVFSAANALYKGVEIFMKIITFKKQILR